MWFLDTKTLRLVGESEFKRRSSQGKYAILSHRWDDEGELSFQDMAMLEHATHGELSFQDMAMLKHVTRKSGYRKIKAFCQHAAREGYEFAWADTCCIDKLSSAELQEAINSMWRWYREASICYVYLHDVQRSNSMWYHDAEWFTRGWTLQELLAPEYTTFFDQDWEKIGNRDTLTVKISRATGIPVYILRDPGLIPRQSIAARMSWAAGRKTTKIEDRAYSLLGLLGVHMPIIYGEQEASMARLQRLLLDRNDETLFAWSSAAEGYHGFLAPSPDAFAGSGRLEPTQTYELGRHPFKSTDAGIRLTTEYLLPYTADVWVVPINCGSDGRRVGLFLRLLRRLPGGMTHFIRVQVDGEGIASATLIARLAERQSAQERKIFLPHPASQVIESSLSAERINGFRIGMSLKRHLDSEMPNESSRWTKTNDFPWSKCGQSKYHLHASLRGNKQIRGFVLGFDRDYNPWCYLREHDAAVGDLDLSQEHFDEQSEPDVAPEGSELAIDCPYRHYVLMKRMLDNRKGLDYWLIKGSRTAGLNTYLPYRLSAKRYARLDQYSTCKQSIKAGHGSPCNVTFDLRPNVDGTMVWEFDITHLYDRSTDDSQMRPKKVVDVSSTSLPEMRQHIGEPAVHMSPSDGLNETSRKQHNG